MAGEEELRVVGGEPVVGGLGGQGMIGVADVLFGLGQHLLDAVVGWTWALHRSDTSNNSACEGFRARLTNCVPYVRPALARAAWYASGPSIRNLPSSVSGNGYAGTRPMRLAREVWAQSAGQSRPRAGRPHSGIFGAVEYRAPAELAMTRISELSRRQALKTCFGPPLWGVSGLGGGVSSHRL